MNQDTKRVLFATDGHPDEDQLLLALERELPVEDTARVEQHLGNCWSCRARFEEMQRGILAFVEYREKRYLPSLPEALQDTSGFRDRLRATLRERSTASLPIRIWRKASALFSWAKQVRTEVRWVSAVATAMAILILWVQVFVNPPAVTAGELLARASAAQNAPTTRMGGLTRRIVHQKVLISRGSQTVVRDFEWQLGHPLAQAQWKGSDPMAWTAPLTAEAFANWRDSLPDKMDTVKRSGDLWTLDTATDQAFIKEAWIVVRADNFRPVEQHLRFRDNQQLDLVEMSFQVSDEPQPTVSLDFQAGPPPQPAATEPVPLGAPIVPELAAVDLDEAELQLRYTLFSHQWDLGEDLSIGRAPGRVTISGTASSRERGQAMQATLSTLPGVQFLIELPSASGVQSARNDSLVLPQNSSVVSVPLLKELLEDAFASRQDRLAFVDRCLGSSDTALSHAWALRRLVERYSEADEQLLKPAADAKLHEMLRTHLQQLSRANSVLEPLFELLPASRTAPLAIPSGWRARILSLFAVAQQQDRTLASLLVGSQTGPQNTAAVSSDFQSAHEAIQALVGSLKDLAGDPIAK